MVHHMQRVKGLLSTEEQAEAVALQAVGGNREWTVTEDEFVTAVTTEGDLVTKIGPSSVDALIAVHPTVHASTPLWCATNT